ncbi:MAG: SsrA-binding protein [Candidatus Pacebacteria bacterium GW2011_GWF2_38_9]|nr:MAG: SsrA-binding protein, SsrA-binding protein [candidate division TM6 bacterium GW2011_GWF2_28_16]KKQ09107.1 MAG: SsrA-binding protein [Candidatus Pacebacteria bacterium GW2011_GWF1_36_5]KKQ88486.1 MAG: SsrA-binding protein [Candidatus Pacebacteria bacterium GW2011_GWF2_38_9]MBU1033445.1 SsrA-binding protein SmpB [Patescibacteria group bacterium]HAZ73379.1 SsrA-binding protein [Candidatus Paceibacterota bacterium]
MSLVFNKKAQYEYTISKKFIAGLVLSGSEVKSLRLKQASLNGSYIKEIGGELFLINSQINAYSFAKQEDYDPKRSRKLLLKKSEVEALVEASKQKGFAIVPLTFFISHNRIKLELALAKGKKEFEKRETIKKRDLKRELDSENKKVHLS